MEVDMHVHSFFSDGYYSPFELVIEAQKKGLKAICLADHDVYQGLPEFMDYCRQFGIETMTGIEISTVYKDIFFHILGYGIDLTKKEILDRYLNIHWQMHRERMLKTLKNYADIKKVEIKISDVRKKIVPNMPYVSNGHLAMYRMRKFNIPFNEVSQELSASSKIRAKYVKEFLMPPESVVEFIKSVGGKVILAHPVKLLRKSVKAKNINLFYEILDMLTDVGILGIEAYHPQNTEEDNRFFEEIAQKRKFFITGGSDYHGLFTPKYSIGMTGISYKDFLRFKSFVER